MASQILAYFVLAFSCFVIVSSSNGTTANLQSIFLGRCNEYIGLKSATMSQILAGKNCSSLYNEFTVVFKDKTTCQTKYDGIFDRFFKLIDPGPSPENKVRSIFFRFQPFRQHVLEASKNDHAERPRFGPGVFTR